jgi:16S rRNA (cytosine1402-N4)-methyltransferase
VGVDRDPHALAHARERLAPFGERVTLRKGCFADLVEILQELSRDEPDLLSGLDGLLVDLGVSSLQLDDPGRGFSFQQAAPLDMRMDDSGGVTATEFLRGLSEAELARVLRDYGEQPRARRVARAIKAYVDEAGVPDTSGLARVVAAVLPRPRGKGGHAKGPRAKGAPATTAAAKRVHPATRAFMAIRIALNDELGQLERFLERFGEILAPGARLAVITFHSLEDRLVKRRFRELSRPGGDLPPGLPLTEAERPAAPYTLLTPRPIAPSADELARNPRARSARLRGLRRRRAVEGEGREATP